MMRTDERQTRSKGRWGLVLGSVAVIVLVSAGVWHASHRRTAHRDNAQALMSAMSGMAAPPAASAVRTISAQVQVDLTADDLNKAGIRTAPAMTGVSVASLRAPGIVKADEYTEVHVTPLAGGLVKEVPVVLGDPVRRGQTLAVIFSSDLAEAQTQYLSDLAIEAADRKKLKRTQDLLQLGAASQQEVEELDAVFAGHQARVQASREKLRLLGVSTAQTGATSRSQNINGTLVVPAPVRGIVLMRAANPGLVATPGQELFTVADLSKVWVMASVNEKDFALVHIGSPAAVTATAYPNRIWKGRVAYIQPQVDPATRTAQARIEIANPDGALRVEMYVDVGFTTKLQGVVVPESAVQAIGNKEFVFVPVNGSEGSFLLREIEPGSAEEGSRTVLSGISPGDQVVTKGSFLLKSEAVRQHPELQ